MTTPNVGTEPMAIASNARWTEPADPLPVFEKPAWMRLANCAGMDPNLFQPERGDNKKVREAQAVCRGCSVVAECLEYALDTNSLGVWGGTTMKERTKMRTRIRRAG